MINLKNFLSGILFCLCSVYAGEVYIIGSADLHGDLTSLAHLAPVIKKYPQAVKVDAGDLIQGGYNAVQNDGMPMFEALNRLGYSVFVPGNHEFEYPSEMFSVWQRYFRGRILGIQWRFGNFIPAGYEIVTRQGYRIGIVGAGESGMRSRAGFYPDLRFDDTIASLHKVMPQLRREAPDAIVLVCHIALQGSFGMIYQILREFPEIDAVISCHSHREHPGEVISGKIVAQPGAYGKSAVLLKLKFSASGKLTMVTSALLRPAKNPDPEIMEISLRAEKNASGLRFVKNFSDFADFGSYAARALRLGCRTDAAICRVSEKYFRTQVDEKVLFRMMPYGNRMIVVETDASEIDYFIRRRSNDKYRCFADIAPGCSGKLKVALPDYLLWSDPQWQKLPRCIIPLFERETIGQYLEKSR